VQTTKRRESVAPKVRRPEEPVAVATKPAASAAVTAAADAAVETPEAPAPERAPSSPPEDRTRLHRVPEELLREARERRAALPAPVPIPEPEPYTPEEQTSPDASESDYRNEPVQEERTAFFHPPPDLLQRALRPEDTSGPDTVRPPPPPAAAPSDAAPSPAQPSEHDAPAAAHAEPDESDDSSSVTRIFVTPEQELLNEQTKSRAAVPRASDSIPAHLVKWRSPWPRRVAWACAVLLALALGAAAFAQRFPHSLRAVLRALRALHH
jgi:hypothetical protein